MKNNWGQRHPILAFLTAGIILLIFIGVINSSPKSKTTSSNQTAPVNQNPQQETKYTYSFEKNGNVESYFIVLTGSAEDKENAARAAIDEMKKSCFEKCNISVYDDAEAKSIDKKSLTNPPTSVQEKDAWNKANYVYVADHLIAFKSFDLDEPQMYPYKDWKYKELKGEK